MQPLRTPPGKKPLDLSRSDDSDAPLELGDSDEEEDVIPESRAKRSKAASPEPGEADKAGGGTESPGEAEPEPERRHLLVDMDMAGKDFDLPVPKEFGGSEDDEEDELRLIDCLAIMKLRPPEHAASWAKTGQEAKIVEYYDSKILSYNPVTPWPRMKPGYFGTINLITVHTLLFPHIKQPRKSGVLSSSMINSARANFISTVLGKPDVLANELRRKRPDIRACLARMRCVQNKKDNVKSEDEGYCEPWAFGVVGGASSLEASLLCMRDGVLFVRNDKGEEEPF